MPEKNDWDNQSDPQDGNDDEIIELTQIVSTDPEAPEVSADIGFLPESEPDLELEAFDFFDTDETPEPGIDDSIAEKSMDPGDEISDEKQAARDDSLPAADSSGTETQSTLELVDRISEEKMEAALERVIEKKFTQKIESILFEVMERVIRDQIREIKDSLQKDLDDIDKI